MNKLPIVFASDENYIGPTYIAIMSLLETKKVDTFYDIYLLNPDNISETALSIIDMLVGKYTNADISFINMGDMFSNVRMTINHITTPTYYRLYLPKLLPQYDKCIYIDSDVIVRDDLSQLFNVDIIENYIAGVLSEGIIKDKYYAKEICRIIQIPNVKTYINAGVVVYNLDKIRKDNIMEKWIDLAVKSFPSQDQDILNVTCFGKIKVLPLKYNVMTKLDSIRRDDLVGDVYTVSDIKDAKNKPVIIHYADYKKPWNAPSSIYANYWWEMFERVTDKKASEYIDKFVKNNMSIPKEKIRFRLKRRLIRLMQIIGIYSTIREIKYKYFR